MIVHFFAKVNRKQPPVSENSENVYIYRRKIDFAIRYNE